MNRAFRPILWLSLTSLTAGAILLALHHREENRRIADTMQTILRITTCFNAYSVDWCSYPYIHDPTEVLIVCRDYTRFDPLPLKITDEWGTQLFIETLCDSATSCGGADRFIIASAGSDLKFARSEWLPPRPTKLASDDLVYGGIQAWGDLGWIRWAGPSPPLFQREGASPSRTEVLRMPRPSPSALPSRP